MLRKKGGVLGGESSGHILCLDKSTTGDGMVVALEVLAVMRSEGCSLADLAAHMPHIERTHLSVPANVSDALERPAVSRAVRAARKLLGSEGRIVVRRSGTEPVVRVMAEGPDRARVEEASAGVARALGGGEASGRQSHG